MGLQARAHTRTIVIIINFLHSILAFVCEEFFLFQFFPSFNLTWIRRKFCLFVIISNMEKKVSFAYGYIIL